MKVVGLIVAAGRGTRAGAGVPKQYRNLCGQPVLRRAIKALLAHPAVDAVQVVIHADDVQNYEDSTRGLDGIYKVCIGGAERHDSVLAGLQALEAHQPDAVLIHDAARPLLPQSVTENVLIALKTHAGAFPALPVVDALWRGTDVATAPEPREGLWRGTDVATAPEPREGLWRGTDVATAPEPREGLWRAQTPQGFRFGDILAAHQQQSEPALDDVAVAHNAGLNVAIVQGSEDNFKITNPDDFDRAARALNDTMDIRTGNGFDVHKFGEGNHVTLCGINIPHSKSLFGHSDADVAMHAVTDAIFGALAEGDIGQWFPPSDAKWKGAASDIFLSKAVERAEVRGFEINHIDCTIICEMPKIGPHSLEMRKRMAEILKIDVDRVSVKATTSEKLGFTGREEGIAAIATATLVKS